MKKNPTKPSTPYIGPGHIFPKNTEVKKPQPKKENQRPEMYY